MSAILSMLSVIPIEKCYHPNKPLQLKLALPSILPIISILTTNIITITDDWHAVIILARILNADRATIAQSSSAPQELQNTRADDNNLLLLLQILPFGTFTSTDTSVEYASLYLGSPSWAMSMLCCRCCKSASPTNPEESPLLLTRIETETTMHDDDDDDDTRRLELRSILFGIFCISFSGSLSGINTNQPW